MKNNSFCMLYEVVSLTCVLYSFISSCSFLLIGNIVLIEYFTYIFVNYKQNGTLWNFSFLFVSTLLLFNFGQVILLAYFQDTIFNLEYRIVINMFSEQQSFLALKYINAAFVSLSIATLLVAKPFKVNFNQYYDSEYILLKIAKPILWLTFPVKIVIDIITVVMSFTVGFEVASMTLQAVPNFIRSYGSISLVALALMLIATRSKPLVQKRWFYFILLYLAIMMFSGWRSQNVAFLLIVIYLYISTKQTNTRKKWPIYIVYGVFGYFILCFIQVVADMRTMNDRAFSDYLEAFEHAAFDGGYILLDSLREFGNTGYTAMCVVINYLNHYSPTYGMSYIYGWASILPNIGGLPGHLTEMGAFATQLQDKNMVLFEYSNIGGSCIGEFFYNFGLWGGVLFAFIIGCLIGKISITTSICISQKNFLPLIALIPLMYNTLYWIRDSFGHLSRDVVWAIAFCYFILNYITHKQYSKKIQ